MAFVATLFLVAPASAQPPADGYTNARRLDGSTSFHQPPLSTVASLKKMATVKGMTDDIRQPQRDAGIPETATAGDRDAERRRADVQGKSCAAETPADSVLVDCDFQPGDTLE